MKKKSIQLALATLLVGSLCLGAYQKDDDKQEMLTLKGEGTFQYLEFNPDFGEMEIEIVIALEGTTTHLDLFQGVETYYFKFELLFDDDGEPVIIPNEYLWHTSTYTAENGDELHNGGAADSSVHIFDPDGTGFSLGNVHISGGTGRFENAEGRFDLIVSKSDPSDLWGAWEFEGEISSPGL